MACTLHATPLSKWSENVLPKQLGSISVVCFIPPPLALIVAVPSSWSRWHPFQAGAERGGGGGGGALQKERESATAKIPAFPPTTFHRSRHLLGCSSKRLSHPSSSTSTRELKPHFFLSGRILLFFAVYYTTAKEFFSRCKKVGKRQYSKTLIWPYTWFSQTFRPPPPMAPQLRKIVCKSEQS